jgi:hypothetical protein
MACWLHFFPSRLVVVLHSQYFLFIFESWWFINFISYISGPKRKYASVVWNSTTPTNAKKLRRVQGKIVAPGYNRHFPQAIIAMVMLIFFSFISYELYMTEYINLIQFFSLMFFFLGWGLLFLLLYTAVSFLFLYKFTDHCHRTEPHLQ